MSERQLKVLLDVLFWLAVVHAGAFFLYSVSPIPHHSEATGNAVVDTIILPIGGLSLVGLVVVGLAAKWLTRRGEAKGGV